MSRVLDGAGGGGFPPRMPWRALGIGFVWLACAAFAGEATDVDPLRAPHRNPDGTFFNPWKPFETSFGDALRWQLSTNPYDKSIEPRIPRVLNDGASLSGHQQSAELTWIGHASVAIHDGDDVVLTDPHFSERALLPKRVVPPGVPIESIPADAFAVVSHAHYDHLDAWTVETLPPSAGTCPSAWASSSARAAAAT